MYQLTLYQMLFSICSTECMNRTKKTKKEGDFVMTHTLNQIMLLMETTLSAAYDAFAATVIYMLT